MSVLHLTTENFNETIENGRVLVDFWAAWCGPCKMVAPIIDELAAKYDGSLTVAKVDTDSEAPIAVNYGITGIPTVILFNDGVEVKRFVGVQSIDAYEAELVNV